MREAIYPLICKMCHALLRTEHEPRCRYIGIVTKKVPLAEWVRVPEVKCSTLR